MSLVLGHPHLWQAASQMHRRHFNSYGCGRIKTVLAIPFDTKPEARQACLRSSGYRFLDQGAGVGGLAAASGILMLAACCCCLYFSCITNLARAMT